MSRCRFFNSGYCKFGEQCKFGHQTQQESFPVRTVDRSNQPIVKKECFDYRDGNCNRGQYCRYAHIESETRTANLKRIEERKVKMEKIIRKMEEDAKQREAERIAAMNYHDRLVALGEINNSPFNLFALPIEILKQILSNVYLSDIVVVCKNLNKKICDLFPIVTYCISESFMSYVGHYPWEKARNVEDAIYQVAVKTIWCKMPDHCGSFDCRGKCQFCLANKSILDDKSGISECEKQYPHFAIFRKKLQKDPTYQRRMNKQFEEERKLQKLFIGNGILGRYQSYMDIKIYNTYFKLQNKTFTVQKKYY